MNTRQHSSTGLAVWYVWYMTSMPCLRWTVIHCCNCCYSILIAYIAIIRFRTLTLGSRRYFLSTTFRQPHSKIAQYQLIKIFLSGCHIPVLHCNGHTIITYDNPNHNQSKEIASPQGDYKLQKSTDHNKNQPKANYYKVNI